MSNKYNQINKSRYIEQTKLLSGKNSNIPFLLFPLRLETKFREQHNYDENSVDARCFQQLLASIFNFIKDYQAVKEVPKEDKFYEKQYRLLNNVYTAVKQIDIVNSNVKIDIGRMLQTIDSYVLNLINTCPDPKLKKSINSLWSRTTDAKKDIITSKRTNPKANDAVLNRLQLACNALQTLAVKEKTPYRSDKYFKTDYYKSLLNNEKKRVNAVEITTTLKKDRLSFNNLYIDIADKEYSLNDKEQKGRTKIITILNTPNTIFELKRKEIKLIFKGNSGDRPDIEKINIMYSSDYAEHYLEWNEITWDNKKRPNEKILQPKSGANPRFTAYIKRKSKMIKHHLSAAEKSLKNTYLLSNQEDKLKNILQKMQTLFSDVESNIINCYDSEEIPQTAKEALSYHFTSVCKPLLQDAEKSFNKLKRKNINKLSTTIPSNIIVRLFQLMTAEMKFDKIAVQKIKNSGTIHNLEIPEKKEVKIYDSAGRLKKKFHPKETVLKEKSKVEINIEKLKLIFDRRHSILFNNKQEVDFLLKQIDYLYQKLDKPSIPGDWKGLTKILEEYHNFITSPDVRISKAKTTPYQLCVRIYPDDIFVSNFRKSLTSEEYNDAVNFWVYWFIYGYKPSAIKSSWNQLCEKYDPYRASWLVRMFEKNMKSLKGSRPYIDFLKFENKVQELLNRLKKNLPSEYRLVSFPSKQFQRAGIYSISMKRPYGVIRHSKIEHRSSISKFRKIYSSIYSSEKQNIVTDTLYSETKQLYQIRRFLLSHKSIPADLCKRIEFVLNNTASLLKEYIAFYDTHKALKTPDYEIRGEHKESTQIDDLIKNLIHVQIVTWDKDYFALTNFMKEIDDLLLQLSERQQSTAEINKLYRDILTKKHCFESEDLIINNDETLYPSSSIMPKRFIFVGDLKNGSTTKRIVRTGRAIPENLQLGISENEEETLAPYELDFDHYEINFNGGIKWFFDYNEAEQCGMAITVPISKKDYDNEFESVYVFGIHNEKVSESSEIIEDFLKGHIYGKSGLDILPAGTATNQIGKFTDYEYKDAGKLMNQRFAIEVDRTKNTDLKKYEKLGGSAKSEVKFDSKLLAEAFGVDYTDTFARINSFNRTDILNSKIANEIFAKYFINQFTADMQGTPGLKTFIKSAVPYLTRYCSSRGSLPSIKIGNQPYGILTTTDFSKYTLEDGRDELHNFVSKLKAVLHRLSYYWKYLRETKVISSQSLQKTDDAERQKRFMQMLSANPKSVEYHQRKKIRHPLLLKNFNYDYSYKNINRRLNLENFLRKKLDTSKSVLNNTEWFSDFITSEKSDPVSIEVLYNEFKEKFNSKNSGLSENELEKLFGEFIDLFSYRLDAWYLGMANYKLHQIRNQHKYKGIHIGAYGILHNLRRNFLQKEIVGKEKKKVVSDMKLKDTKSVIYKDERSEGIMLAPSINHAITAAIMRSAFSRSRKNNGADNRLCINLSSGRMRRAIEVIDGVNNGLSVGAILGAGLERALHEAYKTGENREMDRYIYPLRKAYPLTLTAEAGSKQIESGYTPQIINAAQLLEDIYSTTDWYNSKGETLSQLLEAADKWPSAVIDIINSADTSTETKKQHRIVLAQIIEQIADTYDAINDLMLSEGVYQLVNGNRMALSALMNKMERNTLGQRPEILNIPMRSVAATHKIVMNIPAQTVDMDIADWEYKSTQSVFAVIEPSLNKFAAQIIGNAHNIGIWLKTNEGSQFISLVNAQVSPLEYIFLSANQQTFTDLMVSRYLMNQPDTLWSEHVEVETGRHRPSGSKASQISIFEQQLLVENLRKVIGSGIPLKPQDFMHKTGNKLDTQQNKHYDLSQLKQRIQKAIDQFMPFRNKVEMVLQYIDTKYGEKNNGKLQKLISSRQAVISDFSEYYNITFDDIKQLIELINKALCMGITTVAPIADRHYCTETAPEIVKIIESVPEEETPSDEILNKENPNIEERAAIAKYLNKLKIYETQAEKKYQEDLSGQRAAIRKNQSALFTAAASIVSSIDSRINKVEKMRKELDENKLDAESFIAKSNEIAGILLVKNFKLLPLFTLSNLSDEIKADLEPQLQNNFEYKNASPLSCENWLMDLAKVRKHTKELHLMRMGAMANGTHNFAPLQPIQIPYKETKFNKVIVSEEWIGAEVKNRKELTDRDSLMLWDKSELRKSLKNNEQEYYTTGFVVDSWMELIPKKHQQGGAVFHYDVPNSEPPQLLLLAVPPQINFSRKHTKTWSLDSLIDILEETQIMAKNRAVEPEMINNSGNYARVLPLLSYFKESEKPQKGNVYKHNIKDIAYKPKIHSIYVRITTTDALMYMNVEKNSSANYKIHLHIGNEKYKLTEDWYEDFRSETEVLYVVKLKSPLTQKELIKKQIQLEMPTIIKAGLGINNTPQRVDLYLNDHQTVKYLSKKWILFNIISENGKYTLQEAVEE